MLDEMLPRQGEQCSHLLTRPPHTDLLAITKALPSSGTLTRLLLCTYKMVLLGVLKVLQ